VISAPGLDRLGEGDVSGCGRQVHRGRRDTGHLLQRVFDLAHARGAGHPGDLQRLMPSGF
jgi:hypothetical protein